MDNVAKVAKVWADQLRGDRPDHDLGDDRLNFFTAVLTEKPAIEESKIQCFQDELERLMRLYPGEADYLNVDYHPCRLLKEALESAGIKETMGILPMKSMTCLSQMTKRFGYSSSFEKI